MAGPRPASATRTDGEMSIMRHSLSPFLAAVPADLRSTRPTRARANRAGRSAHSRHQRFPRQSAAAAGRDQDRRSRRQDQEDHGAGRRRRADGDTGPATARRTQQHHLRRRRRPDRRQPVSVGDVSRRADHRIAVDDGAGDLLGRQSRIRRGQGRVAADAERRLPSDRQMPGAASVSRREVSLSCRQHLRQQAPARPSCRLTRSGSSTAFPSPSSA